MNYKVRKITLPIIIVAACSPSEKSPSPWGIESDVLKSDEAKKEKSTKKEKVLSLEDGFELHYKGEGIKTKIPRERLTPEFTFQLSIGQQDDYSSSEEGPVLIGPSFKLEDGKIHLFQCDSESKGEYYEVAGSLVRCRLPGVMSFIMLPEGEPKVEPLEDCISSELDGFILPPISPFWLDMYKKLVAAGRNPKKKGVSFSKILYKESANEIFESEEVEWILETPNEGCRGAKLKARKESELN